MSVTKWHRPIFSGPSPQSPIINSGNGTNDNQRKTLKGDLVWDLRVGRMEQWGVCVLHPKEKGHPDMSCLFSKPSNRKHPNYTYPSPNSNGSSSDNIKQALPHHQQRRLIESPTRNKCRERLSLLLTSLRLPVSTYKITNQDESKNSRKKPAIASSLIQKACYSLGGVQVFLLCQETPKQGSQGSTPVWKFYIFFPSGQATFFSDSLSREQQEPQHHQVNQAGQNSTTNTQKYKLPLESQPTKLGQDPCAKCKHGDCLLK